MEQIRSHKKTVSVGLWRVFLVMAAALLCLVPFRASAQGVVRYPVDNSGKNSSGLLPSQLIDRDTVDKKLRPRKPLESFYFDSTTRQQSMFVWQVSPDNNSITMYHLDTLATEFHIDYPFMQEDVGSASLGNLGAATVPLNYFKRPDYRNFSFVQGWDAYIMTPERVKFYNARKPYTHISYQTSGQKLREEQLFHAVISQNISPSSSFNLDYNADGTRGMYERQRALSRYFDANFAHTGKQYAFHGGYIYNVGDQQENGGIQDMRDVTDTVYDLPDNIPVNLDARADARNIYRGNTFWWTHSYGVPLRGQRETDDLTLSGIPTIFFGQSFQRTAFRKTYSDKVTASTDPNEPSYYENFFFDQSETRDSIREVLADAKLFVQIQPYNRQGALGLVTGGIGYEFHKFYYEVPELYQGGAWGNGGNQTENSFYVYGGAEGAVSRYVRWDADAKLYVSGYRSGDFDVGGRLALNAFVKERPLMLETAVRFKLKEPGFWQQQYFSNHYAWANNFSNEKTTQLSAKFSVPSVGLELGVDYEMTKDKIYYGLSKMPEQFNGTLNMLGVYLRKDFKLGNFHFNHRAMMQWSSEETVAPVPLLSAYASYYFGFNVVKNVLYMQIGVDGRFNSKYYAYGYDPAIGQFHTQDQVKIGGYPYMDAFVSAKWKRLRMLFKLQHWNCNVFGDNKYFSVVNHPQNRMMFKIGISWSFYD